jgi:hypothetical protein
MIATCDLGVLIVLPIAGFVLGFGIAHLLVVLSGHWKP